LTRRVFWFALLTESALAPACDVAPHGGLSNGGLIWKLDGESDLQVGSTVQETGLREACLSLLMGSSFLFVDGLLAVWTLMPKQDSMLLQNAIA
jgi:hypothetical protein